METSDPISRSVKHKAAVAESSSPIKPVEYSPAGKVWHRASRKLVFISVATVTMAVVLITLVSWSTSSSAYMEQPQADCSTTQSQLTSPRTPRPLGNVHSVAELKNFCHTFAPELEKASWMPSNRPVQIQGTKKFSSIKNTIDPVPVCVDNAGIIHVEESYFTENQNAKPERTTGMGSFKDFTVVALTDASFVHNGKKGHAVAVPALGIFVYGLWLATHIWHLIHDAMEALFSLFATFNNDELWSLPTQTVLLQQKSNNWVDHYGDDAKKMAFSGKVLNSMSSPAMGGSFFHTSPTIEMTRNMQDSQNPVPLRPARADGWTPEVSTARLMLCFCQGMPAGRADPGGAVTPATYHGMQDLIVKEFGEQSYLKDLSLQTIEAQRKGSHPWAGKYWKGASTDPVSGVYRPRVLFLHRQSRLIGHVEKYTAALRALNFRVEEIYPEKLPLEEQYYLGRYSDLVVGMHGLGIGHGLWMNRFPSACRTIVEFRPWVTQLMPIQLHRILGVYVGFNYHVVLPIDVVFGPSVRDPVAERKRLVLASNAGGAWSFPGFTDQTAYHNETKVFAMFKEIRSHLDTCLPFTARVRKYSVVGDLTQVIS